MSAVLARITELAWIKSMLSRVTVRLRGTVGFAHIVSVLDLFRVLFSSNHENLYSLFNRSFGGFYFIRLNK